MKIGNGFDRKLRYGSFSVGITAAVIVAVILVNVAVTALCSGNLWFIDTTPEPQLYTLSAETENLLDITLQSVNAERPEDDPVRVDIIFCADPDMLYGNEMMRYIYYTALQMQKAFPESIFVSTRDVWNNPSSVDEYRANSYSSIYQSNVIVASGTEFRVYSHKAFYTYNSSEDEEPWAYTGETNFMRGIIAVTRAEAPICALTVNHGEPFATEEGRAEYSEFLKVIENSGYEIVYLDLENEEIPENCRLIITFDPQTDFASSFLTGGVSETSKLESFLDATYSFMIFADADTPKLTNLEEFLEEWGIAFQRYEDENAAGETVTGTYEVVDRDNALDANGTTIVGQYESEALGGSLTKDMREKGASPKVVFGNALSIKYSPTYQFSYALEDTENNTGAYTYGYYYSNSWSREIFDVFLTGDTAYAYAKEDGERLQDGNGEDLIVDTEGAYRLMTITRHYRIQGEGQGYTNVYPHSYVCAVGSTEFASNEVLSTNAYGNTDTLLGTFRVIGREIVPVGIKLKSLYTPEIGTDYYTTASNTVWTVVLVALPAVIFTGVGVYVLVRRRVRH